MKTERNNKILKIIDRYIGIPFVFFLGLVRKKQTQPLVINNIGILATAAIGDTLIMSGAINSIKKQYPNTSLTIFCGSSNYEISKLLNNVDYVIKIPIKNVLKAKKIIQENHYDIWIDFGPWPRLNSILTSFSKASYKIGFNTKGQFRHYVYDSWVEHSDFIHEHINYCELLKLININEFEKPNLIISKEELVSDVDYVVIHFFAGGSKADLKQLTFEQWHEIVNYIFKKGYKVFLTGAPSDFDKIEHFKKNYNSSVQNVAGKFSLKETAQLLNNSKLTISIDTGIMHLASVLNINLIAIHGPTTPNRWGPLSDNAYTIYLGEICSPCISLGFESKCMNNVCIKNIKLSDITNVIEIENLL